MLIVRVKENRLFIYLLIYYRRNIKVVIGQRRKILHSFTESIGGCRSFRHGVKPVVCSRCGQKQTHVHCIEGMGNKLSSS